MGGVKQKDSDGHIFCRFHLNIIIEENVFFFKKKKTIKSKVTLDHLLWKNKQIKFEH